MWLAFLSILFSPIQSSEGCWLFQLAWLGMSESIGFRIFFAIRLPTFVHLCKLLVNLLNPVYYHYAVKWTKDKK